MSNGNLKNLLTDIADAIRAKEGSSDPINPQDFSTRIANLSSGGSGSGGELEGEYFLAKPNGRYWKLNFITDNGTWLHLNWSDLNEDQQSAIFMLYNILSQGSLVYTCVGQKVADGLIPRRGIHYTTYGKIQSNLGYSMGRMDHATATGNNFTDTLFSCFAWQEAYFNIPPDVADIIPEGYTVMGIFDYIKLIIMTEQGYTPSDEEVYMMLSEMFMIEPITKEEYEDFVSKAEDEWY